MEIFAFLLAQLLLCECTSPSKSVVSFTEETPFIPKKSIYTRHKRFPTPYELVNDDDKEAAKNKEASQAIGWKKWLANVFKSS